MFWNNFEKFSTLPKIFMNLKHEMFWNNRGEVFLIDEKKMNLKHEMFWNATLVEELDDFY